MSFTATEEPRPGTQSMPVSPTVEPAGPEALSEVTPNAGSGSPATGRARSNDWNSQGSPYSS